MKQLQERYVTAKYFEKAPTIQIPFISDEFNRKVQRIFGKYGYKVNIFAKAPATLKDILTNSRLYDRNCTRKDCNICDNRNGKCLLKGVVYKIVCKDCKQFYVGETGRPLFVRIEEHEADVHHNRTRKGPWANHCREQHMDEKVNLEVTILEIERDTHLRKIKEALYIKKLKPKINEKTELADAMKYIGDSQI